MQQLLDSIYTSEDKKETLTINKKEKKNKSNKTKNSHSVKPKEHNQDIECKLTEKSNSVSTKKQKEITISEKLDLDINENTIAKRQENIYTSESVGDINIFSSEKINESSQTESNEEIEKMKELIGELSKKLWDLKQNKTNLEVFTYYLIS